jgi:cobalamin biosynthesis protein CobT
MTPKEIKELQQDGRLFNMVNSIALDMTFRKAVEYLSAIAKGEPLPEASEADETEAGEADPESEITPEEAAPTPTSEDETPPEVGESTPEEDESEDA